MANRSTVRGSRTVLGNRAVQQRSTVTTANSRFACFRIVTGDSPLCAATPESGPWRNFYLTGAAELRGPVAATPAHPAPDLLAALTAEQIFQSMAVRLNGPRAGDRRLLLRWEIGSASDGSDPAAAPEIWTLLLSNGALTPMPGDAPRGERPHATLRLARTTLNAILSGATTFPDQIAAGTVTLDGDAGALLTFNTLLDKPEWNFPIVTP